VLRTIDPWRRNTLVGDLLHLGRLWPELGLPPPISLHDSDLERTLLFEAVTRLLQRLTGDAPVALFIDDLHWADAASLALLGYLAHGLGDLPVLMLGAYRPEGLAESKGLRQLVTTVARSGIALEVPLGGLDRDDVTALAAGILGDDPPAALLDLSARAAGTPLFVDALIRGLLEARNLVRSDSGWVLVGDQSKSLPRGVRDLVFDRLDLLAAEERAVVEFIAHGAQGQPHDVLEGACGLEPEQLLAVVGHLVSAGLVLQEVEGPGIVYRLSHPLVQEVAAAEMPAVAGRRIHALLARTVERLHPRDLDRLAFHYSRAAGEADEERTLEIVLEAGERAQGLSAHDEAARHFAAALPLLRDGRRPELLPLVLERLGVSWQPLGEGAAAIEVWTEALGQFEQAGDALGVARLRRRLAVIARAGGDIGAARQHLIAGFDALRELPPSEELVDLYHARLLIDSPLADPDRARDAVAELGRLAETLASPRAVIEARLAEASLHFALADYETAKGSAEEALRVAEEAGEWLLAQQAHRELAWVAWFLADVDTIRRRAESQLAIDRRLGNPANEAIARMQLAYPALLAGDWEEAVQLLDGAIAFYARRYNQPRYLAMCLGILALTRTYRGDLDGAEECLAEGRQVFPEITTDARALYFFRWPEAALALERGDTARTQEAAGDLRIPVAKGLVGTSQVLAGDLEGALSTAAGLAAQGPSGSYARALADRVLGLVRKAEGDTEAARQHLERSAAAMGVLGLPFEAAVSQLEAGTVESTRLALATFETLGAARYADRSRRVLRGLGVRTPSAQRGRDPD
jgi:tetratricopeptide (TPR) repeat protein